MECNNEYAKITEDAERCKIVAELTEIFPGVPTEILIDVCDRHFWKVDECLDILSSIHNDSKSEAKEQQNQKQEATPAFDLNLEAGYTGAVSKWPHGTPHKSAFLPYNKPVAANESQNECKTASEIKQEFILKQIQDGHRIMIFMRGPSGSGKSYLAKSLIMKLPEPYNEYPKTDFICSTDSYFYSGTQYNFRPQMLPQAHTQNQQDCAEKAKNGYSPIIIDNTNMQLWEMQPYIVIAVKNGYLIETLEPETPWRNSPSKLSMKSRHGVPKYAIERALDRYENLTVRQMLDSVKVTYSMPTPQKRNYPALPFKAPFRFVSFKRAREFEKIDNKENNQQTEKVAKELEKLSLEERSDPNKRLLAILQQNVPANNENNLNESKIDQVNDFREKKLNFERHTVGCANEHSSFIILRQIYPNKHIEGLWDLFVKCNGDIDWSVDILIQESENSYYRQVDETELAVDKFVCKCNKLTQKNKRKEEKIADLPQAVPPPPPPLHSILPKRKSRSTRNNPKPQAEEVKKNVENLFQLTDKQYGEQMRGRFEKKSLKVAMQEEQLEEEEEEEKDEIIKLCIGQELVKQLTCEFRDDVSLSDLIPRNFQRNVDVWIPREMAKELYLLYLESIYSVCEDERAEQTRNDKEIALALAEEQAKNATALESKPASSNAKTAHLMDLATHLSLQKLYEDYPNIPNDTLEDLFRAHNNNYQATTAVLKRFEACEVSNGGSSESSSDNAAAGVVSAESTPRRPVSTINLEAQKKRAILEFEVTRNSAAHHARLKFECYRKAKEAIQLGNPGVALYFSEISRMHAAKIDHFNHQAANCIMNVHKMTTQNPDLLDLHYLHLSEAVVCLDIFLDRHIASLQALKRPYKNIFIITGRGLHSATGVSTIKAHVKARMRERNIRWTEINPGLLRVKLFRSNSSITDAN